MVDFFFRLNIIAVGLFIIFYVNPKLYADLLAMFPPSLTRDVFVIVEITVDPLLVEFFQRESTPRLGEGIDFP